MHAIEEKWQAYKKLHVFESIKYKEYIFFLMTLLHASVSRKSERLTKDEEKKTILFLPLLSLEKYPKKKKKKYTGSF